MRIGQRVRYKGLSTVVVAVFNNRRCIIENPLWDFNEEQECEQNGIEYQTDYFDNVEVCELREL